MFIQTEATPNPATLKFLPGRTVMEDGTFEARDRAEAERSPLARALMELPGVTGVFFQPFYQAGDPQRLVAHKRTFAKLLRNTMVERRQQHRPLA